MNLTEALPYNNYRVMRFRASYFDKEEQVYEEVNMLCPRCKFNLPSLQHGQEQQCGECGLALRRWGNILECTGKVI